MNQFVLGEIETERERQRAKFPQHQNHSDEWWLAIATEELGEVARAVIESRFGGDNAGNEREEIVQLAAVCVAWLESRL